MRPYQAMTLGFVQGLTEFLPVSSTAHLHIVQGLARWPQTGLVVDTSLHLGTLVATLLCLSAETESRHWWTPKRWAQVAVATVPTGVLGLLGESWIEKYLRHSSVTHFNLFLGGLGLWWAESRAQNQSQQRLSWSSALLIGLAQSVALIPGISRSGATLTAARLCGLSHREALRFSFALSVPVVAASGLLKWRQVRQQDLDDRILLLGASCAAVTGLAAVLGLRHYLRQHSLKPFGVYRIFLACALALSKNTR